MKHLPNILSSLRIVGSVALLVSNVSGIPFWVLYIVSGISDIADGWLARKLGCATKTGALLDSLADICFVICCALRLIPILVFPIWLLIWAGVIVVIKIINQVSALVMYGRCCFLHTLANKVTGVLLFLAVPMTFWSIIPISLVAAVATFAAIQEGHLTRTKC
ncbi:MAG: CDP-alcohol phosphatidyltransferase family protein [Bacteroidaceae bacterium]|nr:CDP-alcohol phosphatidyltransferase family protein [Bacteroidaceae bacterium]